MSQLLRSLTQLPDNTGSIPRTHIAPHNCNSSSRRPDTHGKTPMHIFLKSLCNKYIANNILSGGKTPRVPSKLTSKTKVSTLATHIRHSS